MRVLATLFSGLIFISSYCQTSPYKGMYGRALKNAIAQNKPINFSTPNINELIRIYGNTCMLSGKTMDNPVCEQIVPQQWFVTPASYSKDASKDLFNLIVSDASAAYSRNGLPIADVASTNYKVFEPSSKQKGALARAMFYIATMYPADIWEGNGAVVFCDFSPYPTFTTQMAEIYLKWNRNYPPSEAEKAANNSIEQLQGNRNIFIDSPDLAEHIWGENKNKPFGDTSTTPSVQLLKSRYNRTETIYLNWPTADSEAVWTLDGTKVKSLEIPASELKPGQHEISFRSKNRKGQILITIE